MPTSQHPERRKLRRMPAANLSLEWRPRKGLFSRFQPAEGKDFTRNGLSMTIAGNDKVKEGDTVEVRVELSMEAGVLALDKLVATVRNVRNDDAGRPSLGLEFDFNASRTMKSEQTLAQLGRIEGILERSEKLRLRIQSPDEVKTSRV